MWPSLLNVFWLSLKEVRSLLRDWFMLSLVIFSFTFSIISMARNTAQEVHDATIAIADEDQSQLSRAIGQDFLPPYFKPAEQVDVHDIDRLLDRARYTFIVDVRPHFQSDVQAGRHPTVQVNIDATAAMQAGIGSGYVRQIIQAAIWRSLSRTDEVPPDAVTLTIRLAFNPNATPSWFMSVIGIINNITMLAILFRGAGIALIFRDYLAVAGLVALFFVLSVAALPAERRTYGGMTSLRIRQAIALGSDANFALENQCSLLVLDAHTCFLERHV